MSHIVQLNLTIKDLVALEKACQFLGTVELKRNQKHFRYYGGQSGKCDHAISVRDNPQAYELGLVANKDGGFDLNGDFYAGGQGLRDAVGDNAEKLKQEYAAQVCIKGYKKQGFTRVKRKIEENGTLTLIGER